MKCFLDRDGVFNYDNGYVGTIERFQWYSEIFAIMRILQKKGCTSFIVVTNQSGIGRGYYTKNSFINLSKWMSNVVKEKTGINLTIVYCPHTPQDNCSCRKPKSGMFDIFKIQPSDILIGDKETDMLAAKNAGITNRWLISKEQTKYSTKRFSSHLELIRMLRAW